MYKLPKNIDWSFLAGLFLTQIGIGLHQIQLKFTGGRGSDDAVTISIESQFSHITGDGHQVTCRGPNLASDSSTLISLLHSTIQTEGENILIIKFSNKETLHLIDDTDHYESFQISGRGHDIVV